MLRMMLLGTQACLNDMCCEWFVGEVLLSLVLNHGSKFCEWFLWPLQCDDLCCESLRGVLKCVECVVTDSFAIQSACSICLERFMLVSN